MTGKILPLAAMERLLKKAGAAPVSEDAKDALREALEDHAALVGQKAMQFAEHSKRKTVEGVDVRLAVKQG